MTEVKGRGRRGSTKVNIRVKATKANPSPKEDDDSGEEGQTDVRPPSKRRKSSKGEVSKGKDLKGSGGRRDLEGTTDVSGRGKKGRRRGKGKARKVAKGKGVKVRIAPPPCILEMCKSLYCTCVLR